MLKQIKVATQTEQIDLIHLSVRDLGFGNGATTDEIYQKAAEYGLELCPPEVAPHYLLQYLDQPMDEWFAIAMKQIPGPDGYPNVFALARDENGLWLDDYWARPYYHWDPNGELVFCLRK